ncbi:MAG: hypothetical protein EZS26_001597 [Candidatus Ordinivivax streblomastigis]|uniref:Secretion system C-terminal sorting domain-containing protein n=1 Tax=Candidatus Ordinivivax streblomastigis TaxID=2540710 RepID=A0A5M8P1C4_9BACT|nr:MAG: hypothetical protein EZS26_001597 [Candidatus Ordinivivax streblomastigis]
MKQKLLFIFLFLLTVRVSFGQEILRSVPTNAPASVEKTIAEGDSFEWRYCTDNIKGSASAGPNLAMEAAILIPQSVARKYAGQKLTKIKVGFGRDAATNTKIVIRTKSLTSTAVYTQNVTFNTESWNEITLSTPYEITGNDDLYIGYSYKSGGGNTHYSLATDDAPAANPNGDFTKIGTNAWIHIGEQRLPNLCIIGVVEGEALPQYDVDFYTLDSPFSAIDVNEPLSFTGYVKNSGVKPITELEVSYQIGENEKVVQTFSDLNILPNGTYAFNISDDAYPTENEEYSLEVSVDKINGNVDEYPGDNTQNTEFYLWSAPQSRTIVPTQPLNKNVILEEFTGINCQYCPDGHKRANQIAQDNPNRVSVINIHQGGYANVTPDYRTEWGDAIANQTGLEGYPAGTVNRHVFSDQYTALDRGNFAARSKTILSQSSYVNVAINTTVDEDTQKLIVDVELYYTANGAPVNLLNVAIVQDSIMGPQTGGSTYYPAMWHDGKYQHNHMLKDLITKQWGDSIKQTEAGSFVAKRYIYTIPEAYRDVPVNLKKLEYIAFVTEGKQEIISGFSSKFDKVPDIEAGLSKVEKVESIAFIYDDLLSIQSAVPVQSVTIFNVSGQKVVSSTVVDKTVSIKHLTSGVYIVKLQTTKGEKIVKVIK